LAATTDAGALIATIALTRWRTEIGRQHGQPVGIVLGPAIFDRNVLALNITGFLQALTERGHLGRKAVGRCDVEEPDHRHRRLLRKRCARPCDGSAAKRCDKSPPTDLDYHLTLQWGSRALLSGKDITPYMAGLCPT
jgi:hypothetical protein